MNKDDDKIIDITSHSSRRKPEVSSYNTKSFQINQERIRQVNKNIFNNLIMHLVLVNQVITYIILYYLASRWLSHQYFKSHIHMRLFLFIKTAIDKK